MSEQHTPKQQQLLKRIDHGSQIRIWNLDEIDYALSREDVHPERVAVMGIGDNDHLSQMLSALQKYDTKILGIIPPDELRGKKRLYGIFETIPEFKELEFELPESFNACADLVIGIDPPENLDLNLAVNSAKADGGIIALLIPKSKEDIFYPKLIDFADKMSGRIRFLSPMQQSLNKRIDNTVILFERILPLRRNL